MAEPSRPAVLLVDDDESLLHALVRVLNPTRRLVLVATTAEAAGELLLGHEVGVIVCGARDTRLVAFLVEARERNPSIVRVILTGYPDMDKVVNSINAVNPFKLLLKPWIDAELVATVKLAFAQYAVNRKRDHLIDDYASIRASAENSHASHVLDALMAVHPDLSIDAICDLPVGALLLRGGIVLQVNAAAQRFFAARGFLASFVGKAVGVLPAALAALIAAALAVPRRQRRSHTFSGSGRIDYFVLDIPSGTLIAFAPAPKTGQQQF